MKPIKGQKISILGRKTAMKTDLLYQEREAVLELI